MDLKIAHKTVLQQTVERLRTAIMSGDLLPGERLVEAELCSRTGVSRTTIREAVRRLESEKLIKTVPNKGPSVATISWRDAQEIYAVRALLEGEAVARFTEMATKDQVLALKAALKKFRQSVADNDPSGYLEATNEFYGVILSGCDNRMIGEILEGLNARITLLRSRSMSLSGRAKVSVRELSKITNAIANQDPSSARVAAVEHVESACKAAKKYFEANWHPDPR